MIKNGLAFMFFYLLFITSHAAENKDFNKAFISAGFTNIDGDWISECGLMALETNSPYTFASVSEIIDFNGDNLDDLVITDGGSFCAGMSGVESYILISMPDGGWKLEFKASGSLKILDRSSTTNWLEFTVGGPGFCFPVFGRLEANSKYQIVRHEYSGELCSR